MGGRLLALPVAPVTTLVMGAALVSTDGIRRRVKLTVASESHAWDFFAGGLEV